MLCQGSGFLFGEYCEDYILKNRNEVICIFNKKTFFKTLELQNELEKLGHNKEAFSIVNGHRHPTYNENIGGAKLSRHIKGEAVDIVVKDIDGNGRVNKMDKDIILDLLENKIIKDKGGIGLYPGNGNVHYDVRGDLVAGFLFPFPFITPHTSVEPPKSNNHLPKAGTPDHSNSNKSYPLW